MLVECNNCGAPLDVKPNEQRSKCRYCGATTLVQNTRTIAPTTPPQWQPPRQWVPPAHVPADSAKTLIYSAGFLVEHALGLLVTLGVGGLIAALAVCGVLSDLRKKPIPEARTSDSLSVDRTPASRFQSNLLEGPGAAELVKKYQKKLGTPIRAVEFNIFSNHATLTAQDPKQPKHLDEYPYRDGTVESGRAVPTDPYRGKLDQHLFQVEDLPLARLPALVTLAKSKLALENGKVSHVIIRREGGKQSGVTLRVYISSARSGGSVVFDGAGNVQKVYK